MCFSADQDEAERAALGVASCKPPPSDSLTIFSPVLAFSVGFLSKVNTMANIFVGFKRTETDAKRRAWTNEL
jgi:hypothetical protein